MLRIMLYKKVSFVCILAMMLLVAGQSVADVKRFDERNGLSSRHVGSIIEDENGFIWLATWNGLNRFDGYEFRKFDVKPGDGASLGSNRMREIVLWKKGKLACRTDAGIFLFDVNSHAYSDAPAGDIAKIERLMNQPKTAFKDSQLCTWDVTPAGVTRTSDRHHPAHMLAGTEDHHIKTMVRVVNDGKEEIWIGTRSEMPVLVYDAATLNFLRKEPADSYIYAILQKKDGSMMLGGKPTDADTYDYAIDGKGRVWEATFNYGLRCDGKTVSGSEGMRARKLLMTRKGNIIAAATEGLLVVDGNAKKLSARCIRRDGKVAGSLINNATMDVIEDTKGNIYVSTESAGISIITEDDLMAGRNAFTHLNTSNGMLPDDVGYSMAWLSKDKLAITSLDKVIVLDVEKRSTTVYNSVFWGEGDIRFSESRPLLLNDGALLVGTESGAYVATRKNMYSPGFVPPLRITSISNEQRNYVVKFATLDFVDNSQIMYRTRFDGSEWSYMADQRTLLLFELKPGKHVLEVQSTDRYGRWVDNNTTLDICVEPYWYETWWATLLLWVVIIGVTALITYIVVYIRNIRRERSELLAKYMALIAEAKPNEEVVPVETDKISEYDNRFLEKVRGYVEANLDNSNANIDDMASKVAVSKTTLNRRLKSLIGITAAQLLIDARLQKAKALLDEQSLTVSEVAYQCGYTDAKYFSKCYKAKYGVTPSGKSNSLKKTETKEENNSLT